MCADKTLLHHLLSENSKPCFRVLCLRFVCLCDLLTQTQNTQNTRARTQQTRTHRFPLCVTQPDTSWPESEQPASARSNVVLPAPDTPVCFVLLVCATQHAEKTTTIVRCKCMFQANKTTTQHKTQNTHPECTALRQRTQNRWHFAVWLDRQPHTKRCRTPARAWFLHLHSPLLCVVLCECCGVFHVFHVWRCGPKWS